jgi:hypothetical protein
MPIWNISRISPIWLMRGAEHQTGHDLPDDAGLQGNPVSRNPRPRRRNLTWGFPDRLCTG